MLRGESIKNIAVKNCLYCKWSVEKSVCADCLFLCFQSCAELFVSVIGEKFGMVQQNRSGFEFESVSSSLTSVMQDNPCSLWMAIQCFSGNPNDDFQV